MKGTFLRALAAAGVSVNISSFPSTVAVITNSILESTDSLFQAQSCGGTLISSTWVLTAAHCVVDGDGIVAPASAVSVLTGSTDLTAPVNPVVQVSKIIVHEDYQQVVFGDDIALLQLTAKTAAPAIAMNENKLLANESTFIVGWGSMASINPDGSGSYPKYLQGAIVPVIDGNKCANLPGNYQFVNPDTQICAGFRQGGIDSCKGDSGGPLYSVTDDGNLRLAGITSWGNGCAYANQPGIYTDVLAFREWIDALIGDGPDGIADSGGSNNSGELGDASNSSVTVGTNGVSVNGASDEPVNISENIATSTLTTGQTPDDNADIRSLSGGGGASLLFLPALLLLSIKLWPSKRVA